MYNFASHASVKHETRGETRSTSRGTSVTASATANLMGSWTSIGAVTTFDYEMLHIYVSRSALSDFLIDIGIQTSGGDSIICHKLSCPSLRATFATPLYFPLPIHVPAGAQLRARCQATTGSSAISLLIIGSSRGINRAPGYPRIANYVASATNASRGFDLDPGNTANTFSAWQTINSSASVPASEIMIMVGGATDISAAAAHSWLLDIGVGTATNTSVIQSIMFSEETAIDWPGPSIVGIFPQTVRVGDAITARIESSGTATGDRLIDVMVYGIGGP